MNFLSHFVRWRDSNPRQRLNYSDAILRSVLRLGKPIVKEHSQGRRKHRDAKRSIIARSTLLQRVRTQNHVAVLSRIFRDLNSSRIDWPDVSPARYFPGQDPRVARNLLSIRVTRVTHAIPSRRPAITHRCKVHASCRIALAKVHKHVNRRRVAAAFPD